MDTQNVHSGGVLPVRREKKCTHVGLVIVPIHDGMNTAHSPSHSFDTSSGGETFVTEVLFALVEPFPMNGHVDVAVAHHWWFGRV